MSNVTRIYGTTEQDHDTIIIEEPSDGESLGKVDVTHYHYNRRNIHLPWVQEPREKPEANAVRIGIWTQPGCDIELNTCFQGTCEDGLEGITNSIPVFDLSVEAAHNLIDMLQTAIRVSMKDGN